MGSAKGGKGYFLFEKLPLSSRLRFYELEVCSFLLLFLGLLFVFEVLSFVYAEILGGRSVFLSSFCATIL